MTDAADHLGSIPERPALAQPASRVALQRALATLFAALGGAYGLAAALTYNPDDPSFNVATDAEPSNLFGAPGAAFADLAMQSLGLAAPPALAALMVAGVMRIAQKRLAAPAPMERFAAGCAGAALIAGVLSLAPIPNAWPLDAGLGGLFGDGVGGVVAAAAGLIGVPFPAVVAGLVLTLAGAAAYIFAFRIAPERIAAALRAVMAAMLAAIAGVFRGAQRAARAPARPRLAPAPTARLRRSEMASDDDDDEDLSFVAPTPYAPSPATLRADAAERPRPPVREAEPAAPRIGSLALSALAGATPRPARASAAPRAQQAELPFMERFQFRLPGVDLLSPPKQRTLNADGAALAAQSKALEAVLADFNIQGEIVAARPGPVVTLFELEPTPGVRSQRVISLADDIARSMSATAARVAVIPGRNAIGIELPNAKRDTVYLRTLLGSNAFVGNQGALPLALGETIEGEPFAADLAKMPHLLIAGTTGSGKSVGINAMILSLLYRHSPQECRFIMIDPKMLELSVYEGIPHLLAPVVTDPKKAVVALKWTVREMEERYKRMSRLGVRNIQGYNERVAEALANGERLQRQVPAGFDPETGEPMFETFEVPAEPMPFIVVVIDEMADLMIVAGKEIEAAVQRLAQMARAAGIHLIMATQRPSVDVITGTIKANFPTRISYSVTTKIDSRTILGEQGAEQLLGMGDLLYMASGGRIRRLHGPFVSDAEVERVVAVLKAQAAPSYRADVLDDPDAEEEDSTPDYADSAEASGDDLFDRAVEIVRRDKRASTSYIQRRLQVGYNRAATLIERMEQEGVISKPNAAGKREVLAPTMNDA